MCLKIAKNGQICQNLTVFRKNLPTVRRKLIIWTMPRDSWQNILSGFNVPFYGGRKWIHFLPQQAVYMSILCLVLAFFYKSTQFLLSERNMKPFHIGTKDRKNGNFVFLQLLALNFASSQQNWPHLRVFSWSWSKHC